MLQCLFSLFFHFQSLDFVCLFYTLSNTFWILKQFTFNLFFVNSTIINVYQNLK